MALQSGKWDVQLGDQCTLAPFPLLLRASTWHELSALAEALTQETLALEDHLALQPHLWSQLGLPAQWHLPASLEEPAIGRIFRFDFHWTARGWRLSEVNSDVPGGYAEATDFPALMASHFPGTTCCGAPGEVWTKVIEHQAKGAPVGLLAAPGYLEDQQVLDYLAQRTGGLQLQPRQLEWREGRAYHHGKALGALVRFYQGEWLWRQSWGRVLLEPLLTPVLNSGRALFSENKRLPLLWKALDLPLPTWRSLLPETREPSEVPWETDESWVLKKGWSNTGDSVHCVGWNELCHWQRAIQRSPHEWVAQKRFETEAVAGLKACLGVYTIEGRAAGIYGRISPSQIVNYEARDVAVLLETVEAGDHA